MKRIVVVTSLVVASSLLLGARQVSSKQAGTESPQSSYSYAFTYQGQLNDAGGPINGNCDLQFGLWDAPSQGMQVGSILAIDGIELQEGLFTARLDFGAAAHYGGARWLEVAVRCPAGSGNYETLSPRQELTPAPAALTLAMPFRAISGNNGPLIQIENTNSSDMLSTGILGSGYVGVIGMSASVGGMGVRGRANASSGASYGVYGESLSTNGSGVYGQATADTGSTYGVTGYSSSTSGIGIYGFAGALSGETHGVYGQSSSDSGTGVYGTGYVGVEGSSDAIFGRGVAGYGNVTDWGTGVYGQGRYGVVGWSNNDFGYGVHGSADAPAGTGVYGEGKAETGLAIGVDGHSDSTSGIGVHGWATAMSGTNYGVYGYSSSTSGRGVHGRAGASTGSTTGVYGESISTSGRGLIGDATSTSGTTYGVVGYSASPDGYAGYFRNTSSGVGLYVKSDIGSGGLIEAFSSFTDREFAVSRDGNVYADGTYSSPAADYAELLPASTDLEPGDVLIVGPEGLLTCSTSPAQTSVVGVYSTQPAFLAGADEEDAGSGNHVPLAVMGVVPVKVTAENGFIKPGDLLTTSSTPGHAMRAGMDPLPGTVIGKALQPWSEDSEMILMLVMLR